MTGFEGLSDLFEFHVAAMSKAGNVDFKEALGKSCTVEFMAANGATRYFNGVLTEAHWADGYQDLSRYELVLRPWTWLLTRASNSRIFKNLNAVDIIKQVFTDQRFTDFRDEPRKSRRRSNIVFSIAKPISISSAA